MKLLTSKPQAETYDKSRRISSIKNLTSNFPIKIDQLWTSISRKNFNFQDKLYKKHHMSNFEMMFGVASMSSLFTAISLLLQG